MAGDEHFPHLLEVLPERGDVTARTLELLWRAAPEQTEELDKTFAAGVRARLTNGRDPIIGVAFNVLQIPEGMLKQLWLLAHAAWRDFCEFDKLKENSSYKTDHLVVAEAIEAAKGITDGKPSSWPGAIPAFNEIVDGVEAKAVREIYAMAGAWVIAHEMKHAKFFEDADRPENPIDEEFSCDAYAADFLFSKIDAYAELTHEEADKVRGKRAISALVGLYYVARLSPESKESETHPPVQERIKLLFDKVGKAPSKHFWGFATALLWGLKPDIATRHVGDTTAPPSSRDLAYMALEYAFE